MWETVGAFVLTMALVTLVAYEQSTHYWELNQMKEMSAGRYAMAMRSGRVQAIPLWDLKFGDIIHIEAGSVIHASGLLIEGT